MTLARQNTAIQQAYAGHCRLETLSAQESLRINQGVDFRW